MWLITYTDGTTEEKSDEQSIELVVSFLDDTKELQKIERIQNDDFAK